MRKGRHRAVGRKRTTRHGRRPGILDRRVAGWVVMGALAAGGVAAVGLVDDKAPAGATSSPADMTAMRSRERESARSSRGDTRTAPPATPTPTATPTPKATTAPKKSAKIVPIGGLTQRQMDHAITIVRAAESRKMPERAMVVALSTALQESYLRNLANPGVPESENLPNDGDGADHDSVGLFQQRPSSGWGTVEQIMDPSYAAGKFLDTLAKVPGWESMSVTVAAQTVQVSAYPDAYAQHESFARKLVAAIRHPG